MHRSIFYHHLRVRKFMTKMSLVKHCSLFLAVSVLLCFPLTYTLTVQNESKSSKVDLQLLINQETLIRLELDKEIRSLRQDIEAMKKQNTDVKECKNIAWIQNEDFSQLKVWLNDSATLRESVDDLNQTISVIKKTLADNLRKVAFETAMVHDSKGSRGSVLKFGHVVLNEGNGYNYKTGKFTAPKEGVYIFGWHILPRYRTLTSTELIVNGTPISWIYCHTKFTGGHQPCSKMAVVNLKLGDNVWIAYYGNGEYHVKGKFTSFTGVKI